MVMPMRKLTVENMDWKHVLRIRDYEEEKPDIWKYVKFFGW